MTLPPDTTDLIARAYEEDLGGVGDITSTSVIDAERVSSAVVVARQSGTIAGMEVAEACFHHVDPTIDVHIHVDDGSAVVAGTPLATVFGPTASILTAERVALNFVGRLSGIATATSAFVEAVEGTGAAITDTRKTTPGLRALEKLAVVTGGGVNHRIGLYDAILIKDNHLTATDSISSAVSAARAAVGRDVMVEVEVDTLDQLDEVLETDADRVLLDNMDLGTLREAVARVAGAMVTEASGGVNLDTVRGIAETGVDIISVGWLTHSPPNFDVALDFAD